MKSRISVILLLALSIHPMGKSVTAQGAMYPNYSNAEKVANLIHDIMFYDGANDGIGWFRAANITLGYQVGYASWNQSASHSFDLNARFLYLSGGYTFQNAIRNKAYVGLGLGDLFNVQYGYAFNTYNHLLRVRSDIDIGALLGKDGFLTYIGIYAEKSFGNNQYSGYSLGVTVSISAAVLLVPFLL